MKQVIGEKKLRRCREVGGKPYGRGYTRGGWEHGMFQCWFDPRDGRYMACDFVNIRTGEVEPHFRDGHYIPPSEEPK